MSRGTQIQLIRANWKSHASANGNMNPMSMRSIGRVLPALMATEISGVHAQWEEPCQRERERAFSEDVSIDNRHASAYMKMLASANRNKLANADGNSLPAPMAFKRDVSIGMPPPTGTGIQRGHVQREESWRCERELKDLRVYPKPELEFE
jgi:hypothetical protein